MKSLKILAPILGALCFFACKKDNDTPAKSGDKDTVVVPAPIPDTFILNKVVYWNSNDTTKNPYTDSIIYLGDGKTIDKIVYTHPYYNGATVAFSYNANGTFSHVQIKGEDQPDILTNYNMDYYFYYSNNSTQLDSMLLFEHVWGDTICIIPTYNEQHKLSQLTTSYYDEGIRYNYMVANYERNAAGYIENIAVGRYGANPGISYKLNAPVAADTAIKLPQGVLFWMGARVNANVLHSNRNSLTSQQFFLNDENIIRSGTITYQGATTPMTATHTVDTNGTLNFLSFESTHDLSSPGSYTIKLQSKRK